MKFIIGLSVVALFFVACKRTSGPETPKKAERPMVVQFDGWWASDYAVEGARMKCNAEHLSPCEGENNVPVITARQDESEFEERFSGAFQSDPNCSGITLRGFGGRNHRITTVGTLLKAGQAQANFDSTDKEYWLLISVRLDVEQIQLVSEVGLVGSVEIGLKGA